MFDEGRRLMAKGDYAGAVPQFEKILQKTHAVGALLNLGECHAKLGHTASAYTAYKDAAATASETKDNERKAIAEQLATALESKLSYLVIRVATPEPSGLEIRKDGAPLPRGQWRAPIDPGAHRIEATAPGRVAWSSSVHVTGAETTVDVPVLAPVEAPPPPPREPAPDTSDGPSQRTIAIVAGGIGVAGLALGAVGGLVAMSKYDDAKSRCPSYPDRCSSDGSAQGPNDDAQTWATISTIGFGVGIVGLAAGAVLWFTAPAPRAPAASARALRIVPSAGARTVGIGFGGSF